MVQYTATNVPGAISWLMLGTKPCGNGKWFSGQRFLDRPWTSRREEPPTALAVGPILRRVLVGQAAGKFPCEIEQNLPAECRLLGEQAFHELA